MFSLLNFSFWTTIKLEINFGPVQNNLDVSKIILDLFCIPKHKTPQPIILKLGPINPGDDDYYTFPFEEKDPRFTRLKPGLALRLLSKGLFYIRAMDVSKIILDWFCIPKHKTPQPIILKLGPINPGDDDYYTHYYQFSQMVDEDG